MVRRLIAWLGLDLFTRPRSCCRCANRIGFWRYLYDALCDRCALGPRS